MNIENRIRMSLLLEKMYEQKEYSEKLGLEDISKFHGEVIIISRKEEKRTC